MEHTTCNKGKSMPYSSVLCGCCELWDALPLLGTHAPRVNLLSSDTNKECDPHHKNNTNSNQHHDTDVNNVETCIIPPNRGNHGTNTPINVSLRDGPVLVDYGRLSRNIKRTQDDTIQDEDYGPRIMHLNGLDGSIQQKITETLLTPGKYDMNSMLSRYATTSNDNTTKLSRELGSNDTVIIVSLKACIVLNQPISPADVDMLLREGIVESQSVLSKSTSTTIPETTIPSTTTSQTKGRLRSFSYVVCADGGSNALRLAIPNAIPDAIVGDFDSVDPNLVSELGANHAYIGRVPALVVSDDQDSSDLHKSLAHLHGVQTLLNCIARDKPVVEPYDKCVTLPGLNEKLPINSHVKCSLPKSLNSMLLKLVDDASKHDNIPIRGGLPGFGALDDDEDDEKDTYNNNDDDEEVDLNNNNKDKAKYWPLPEEGCCCECHKSKQVEDVDFKNDNNNNNKDDDAECVVDSVTRVCFVFDEIIVVGGAGGRIDHAVAATSASACLAGNGHISLIHAVARTISASPIPTINERDSALDALKKMSNITPAALACAMAVPKVLIPLNASVIHTPKDTAERSAVRIASGIAIIAADSIRNASIPAITVIRDNDGGGLGRCVWVTGSGGVCSVLRGDQSKRTTTHLIVLGKKRGCGILPCGRAARVATAGMEWDIGVRGTISEKGACGRRVGVRALVSSSNVCAGGAISLLSDRAVILAVARST